MNKLAKFADMATYPHVFQANFEDVREKDFDLKGNWASFFGNKNPIVVELGCGKGEYAVGLARQFHNVNYIGVDIKGARMHTGATQALNEGLKNIAFIRTHIELLDHFFSQDEISEIWVTFPDPQMKKARKRLVGTTMLRLYRKFLRHDGFINLKTDSPFLFEYTKAMMEANSIRPTACTADLYADGDQGPTLGIKTYYEERWLSVGLPIKYIRFNLPAETEMHEPDIKIDEDNYHNVGQGVQLRKSASPGQKFGESIPSSANKLS